MIDHTVPPAQTPDTPRATPAAARTTTTVRLPAELHEELVALSRLDRANLNQVVEASLRAYLRQRRNELEHRLERALAAIRAQPGREGDFDAAITRLVRAESALGTDDPAEGRAVDLRSQPAEPGADLAARVRGLLLHP